MVNAKIERREKTRKTLCLRDKSPGLIAVFKISHCAFPVIACLPNIQVLVTKQKVHCLLAWTTY